MAGSIIDMATALDFELNNELAYSHLYKEVKDPCIQVTENIVNLTLKYKLIHLHIYVLVCVYIFKCYYDPWFVVEIKLLIQFCKKYDFKLAVKNLNMLGNGDPHLVLFYIHTSSYI